MDKIIALERARGLIDEFINQIANKYDLNYYEILGLIDVIREDIHVSSRKNGLQ